MKQVFTLDENYSTTRRVIEADLKEITRLITEINQSGDVDDAAFLLPKDECRRGEGGLRTCGYSKIGNIITERDIDWPKNTASTDLDLNPLITVITVVFNGEEFIEETILSVLNQTYDNIEYIIIDGGSTDRTIDIIQKYEHAIDYWVSEPDRGIYDAMNKGIRLATGKWINFMNGGDGFYNNTVVNDIFSKKDYSGVSILYGNHQVIYQSGRKRIAKAGCLNQLWKGSQFCHQATFIDNYYHKKNKYNDSNGIVADFGFFYKAKKEGVKFIHTDLTIARFQAGGLSDVNRIEAILGWWILVEKNPKVNLYYLFIILIEQLKSFMKTTHV